MVKMACLLMTVGFSPKAGRVNSVMTGSTTIQVLPHERNLGQSPHSTEGETEAQSLRSSPTTVTQPYNKELIFECFYYIVPAASHALSN